MDLNLLVIFAKIAEKQSFTKASELLHMDKSTVSNKLAQLESRLGVRLLNRSTRSVTLTEAGEGYYQYCKQILETANEAEIYATTLGNEPVGLLRVSASNDFAQLIIPKIIQPFLKANPKVALELILEYREADLVKEKVDIALRVGISELEDSNVIAREIMASELGLYCSPAYIQATGLIEKLDQLPEYDLIEFTPGPSNMIRLKKDGQQHIINMAGRFKVNDIITARDAAVAGLGIAGLPGFVVEEQVRENKLVRLLTDWESTKVSIYAVYASRKWMPAKQKVFLEYLAML